MKRRKLLQTIALASGSMLLPVGCNSWVAKEVSGINNRKRLVTIFLRGAIDGLNVVVPHQDSGYYEARPTIAVPYPGEKGGAIDLDGFFGLHPGLKDILPLWKEKSLAFIHNSGSPNPTRSHFDAQDYMESGTPGVKSTADGWMNRLLFSLPQDRPTQAINVGNTTPKILQGKMAVANLTPGKNSTRPIAIDRPRVSAAFDLMYAGQDSLSKAYQEGTKARGIILEELNQEMMSANGNAGSVNKFVDDAGEVAQLMVSDARTQLAFMEVGGWDTHIGQKATFKRSLPNLGKGLATLAKGLGSLYSDTVIVVISEFGRTVKENGNGGTDHGHGNVMWLLGGGINGGKIYHQWQGLGESELYQGRDLPVEIDFRNAIAEIMKQHLSISNQDLAYIFPQYKLANSLNLLR
ncbi:MAG: DUF1501 domain-containing protein [Xenococcaceae cyanobacterium MO_188.B19]|nr:DUF1501 domain-containing protein [Xenococcaceae cyanobacterium MO_188.B19]